MDRGVPRHRNAMLCNARKPTFFFREVFPNWSNLDVVFLPRVHPQHHHGHAGGDAGEQNIPEHRLGDDYLGEDDLGDNYLGDCCLLVSSSEIVPPSLSAARSFAIFRNCSIPFVLPFMPSNTSDLLSSDMDDVGDELPALGLTSGIWY